MRTEVRTFRPPPKRWPLWARCFAALPFFALGLVVTVTVAIGYPFLSALKWLDARLGWIEP